MAKVKAALRTPHTGRHGDGSLWSKGYMRGGVMDGPWRWFRKDGTIMRSGSFDNGVQVGKWVTYGQDGRVVIVPKKKARTRAH
jgi:antitoxin component YwqK of YwqJK toxin-antitoxin module